MTVELSKVTFSNDFFSIMLPDGKYLVLNKVDESLKLDNEQTEYPIKAVNIELQDLEGNTVPCPCVIGMSNEIMQINTAHKEYQGKVLTPDNMVFCTIEVYE